MLSDLRFALRQLARRPGFTALVALILALGIGANTAIFSVLHGVLLRPLPYETPERIVRLLGFRRDEGLTYGTISYPNFSDIRARNAAFEAMAAYDEWRPTLRDDDPLRLDGASVNAGFFAVLGVRPALGRFFLPEEDGPGAAQAVVISHQLWVERFGAAPAVLEQTLDLSGTLYQVVGVTPRSFEDPGLSGSAWGAPQVWRVTPSYFDPLSSPRGGRAFTAVGRLRPEVSLDQARAEVETIMARLREAYPEANTNRAIALRPLADDLLGGTRRGLWVVAGAVGLVLLIACANVANLLLARAAERSREIGVRTAMGASRWRIGRQLLIESLLLAGLGGAGGLALALLGTDLLAAAAQEALPRRLPTGLDWPVLAFTAGIALLAGVGFGMVPLLETARVDIGSALKQEARGATSGRGAGRMRMVIGAQMALSLSLLVGAALLLRSLWNLVSVPPGLNPEGVLTLEVDPSGLDFPDVSDAVSLYDRLLPAAAGLPGVSAVGAVDLLPMGGSFNGMTFSLSDRATPPPGERWSAELRVATAGFFRTAGIPLLRGRSFTEADRGDDPPVAMVNLAFAERWFPGSDPIGVGLTVAGTERRIIGVVGDVHQFALDQAPDPTVYLPHRQMAALDMVVLVRGSGDLTRLAGPLRSLVGELAPQAAVENIRPMTTVIADTIAPQRFRAVVFGLFAGLAVLLGAVGIYGVVAYAVIHRTHEVGIRLALGARADRMVRMLLLQGMRPVLLGGAAGIVGGIAAGQLLEALLFGVNPLDPVTFGGAALLLAAAAGLACWLPARRVARIEPMEALRHE